MANRYNVFSARKESHRNDSRTIDTSRKRNLSKESK